MAKSVTNTQTKYPYKTPFISKPKDDDLSKQWVVEYGIWSEREEKIKRKRVVLVGTTVAERLADGREVVKELNRLLKAGAVVDPVPVITPVAAADLNQVKPNTPLSKAIDIYLAYKTKTTKKNSVRTYRSSLNLLKRYLVDTPGLKTVTLQQFRHGDALAFLDKVILDYKLTNRGHNNTRDNCAMFYRHWCKRINATSGRVILVNPFDNIDEKVTTSGKHTAYTDEQRAAFKDKCLAEGEGQLLTFVQFMYYTFMRPRQELRLLRIKDIREDTIFINAVNAKDNAAEYIEIPPGLQRIITELQLRDYPDNHYVFTHQGVPGPDPVGPDYFYSHHRRILDKLALKDEGYDMYSWKHTGVIALWNATQNIRLIQQQCRHSTAAQTEDYLRDLGIIVRHTQIKDFPEF